MHLRDTVVTILLAGSTCILAPRLNAQQPVTGQLPSFRSGVELVTVDVGVLDKAGQPVHGLTSADFIVTVDGRRRRVVTAEFVDAGRSSLAAGQKPDVAALSTNEGGGSGRLILFVVDSNTLEAGGAKPIADAASQFLSRLTLADRSAIVSLPVGRSFAFSWAHHRVRDALLHASGTGGAMSTWEHGSLSEARDIATRRGFVLSDIAARECSSTAFASSGEASGGIGTSPGQSPPSSGGQSGGTGGGAPGSGGTGGQPSPGPAGVASGGSRGDQCLRDLQNSAAMTWSMARTNSLSSIGALRDVLAALQSVRGDKTVVLISGGWPLEDQEQTSILTTMSAEATAARSTVFTVFVPRSSIAASRRSSSATTLSDEHLYSSPLENLASMTGGRTFKANAGVGAVFERLATELAGYYRLGVEKDPSDAGARNRRMQVHVARRDVVVRSRAIFDETTYEDRDWSARLASALNAPTPATAVALRMTSYLAPDFDNPANLRVVLAGVASRLQPGDANLVLVVRDLEGRKVVAADRQLGTTDGRVTFATNVQVPPGTYVVRVAVMDGAGRVGSVDHLVEARAVSLGPFAVTGPLLVQLPHLDQGEPHFTVDSVRQGERLALEVGVSGDRTTLKDVAVQFEIAASADGSALVEQPATLSPERAGSVLAQAVVDTRTLPAGDYVARVKVKSGADTIGEMRRAFTVVQGERDR